MPPTDNDPPPQFPFYVRVLAVAHVLSWLLGPLGLIVFGAMGCILFQRRGQIDATILAVWAAGISCPAVGGLYRRWFEHWGRMNWPDGRPDRF